MSKSSLRPLILGLILVGIGALTFLPRVVSLDAHWSSDETLWLNRSRNFMLSLQHTDFPGTLQSHHPGVITMWLGGASLWARYGETLSDALTDEEQVFSSPSNLARCRFMIALTTGGILLIAFLLMRKLFGTKIAILAALFLAVDPMYLTQARRLHTDALSTSFLLLCILTLLVFFHDFKQVQYLILSGICFGIACLSKSNALIAVLYFPLLMLSSSHSDFSLWIGRTVLAGLIWLGVAAFTFIIGWPAILCYGIQIAGIWVPVAGITAIGLLGMVVWTARKLKRFVGPETDGTEIWKSMTSVLGVCGVCLSLTAIVVYGAVSPVLEGVGWALTTQHEVQHFFLGKIVSDPGLLFYPLMLSIQSAPLTLPLSLIGFLFLRQQRHNPKYARTYEVYAGLAVFVILFTFCMALGAKKMSRYLLPVFPVLDILAAVAGHFLVEKVFQMGVFRRLLDRRTLVRNGLKVLMVGLIVLVQVVPVLRLQPHYGTYYNPCWKVTDITKICSIGGAYGLDLAADYLNQKPNSQALTVHVSPLSTSLFGHYFRGESYPRDNYPGAPSPDYEVAYIRDVQINRVHLSDIHGTLEHIIRLNGIDYVWIYRSRSP